MEIGAKTIFLLNTLLLTNTPEWHTKYLIRLISMFNDFVEDEYDENRLLLTYNPLMAIALSAELLIKISKTRKRFENQCKALSESLLDLGKKYNLKIDDE